MLSNKNLIIIFVLLIGLSSIYLFYSKSKSINNSINNLFSLTNQTQTALVYSGISSIDSNGTDCAIPVYNLLLNKGYIVNYCGSGLDTNGKLYNDNIKRIPLTLENLKNVSLYVQPGGGDDIVAAWNDVKSYSNIIKQYISEGGKYLGICMGGFLAGGNDTNNNPGYSLLTPGDSNDFSNAAEKISIKTDNEGDLLLNINWTLSKDNSKQNRFIYFQGGPYFITKEPNINNTKIIATYTGSKSSQQNASIILNYGKGKVAVCGPHPEAPKKWYKDSGFSEYDNADLFYDLIEYLK